MFISVSDGIMTSCLGATGPKIMNMNITSMTVRWIFMVIMTTAKAKITMITQAIAIDGSEEQ